MSEYVADLGLLDFDAELGAAPKKKKKKKKLGARIKKGLKKVGKGLAVVSTGGVALAAMKPKKLLAKAKKSKAGKALLGKAKKLGLKAKAKVKSAVSTKVMAAGGSPQAAKTIAKVATARASDCGSKSDLAAVVAAQLTASLAPRINEANNLLAKFDLQRTATAEHKRLMSEADFRREVLSLLALKAANGNTSCRDAVRVIMRGR